MKRRTAILGFGSLAVGSSAALGTSAFTNVEAERQAAVDVQDDTNSYLALVPADDDGEPVDEPESGGRQPDAQSEPYAVIDDTTGRISLNLTALNDDAEFTFPNIFVIQNRGSRAVDVTISKEGPNPDVLTFFTEVEDEKVVLDEAESDGVEIEDGESATIGIDADTFGIEPDDSIIDEITVEGDARGDNS